MALIPSDTLEDIRLQNDIVSIVGQYVRLEKRGRNYVGACPFHQERDPSFSVSSEKQIFYCFGCQAGGNVFKFLMLIENLTFMESVRRLAGRAGIVIPDPEGAKDSGRQAFREERAWEINGLARNFYHHNLLNSTEAESARRYLALRGISQEVIAEFKIGYALNSWDSLVRFFGTRNYQTKELIDLGLAGGDSNRVYDRFRNRIIFPVSNHQGKVVAFGGRIIDKADNDRNLPKYLNTSDTFFFHKSKILYGLDLAIKHIRDKGHAVLMEGYLDVITAHQFGINNAVASMGTSLTLEQGNILARYTKDIFIAYDSDSAGLKAASRGLDILQTVDCRLRVVNMPDGDDPDDFLRRCGVEGWNRAIESSESLLEFKIKQAQKKLESTPEILNEIVPNLSAIKNNAELEENIRLVSSRLNLSWESIKSELSRYKNHKAKSAKAELFTKNDKNGRVKDAVYLAEQGILKLLIKNSLEIDFVESRLGNDFFENPKHQTLYGIISGKFREGKYLPGEILNELEGDLALYFSRLAMEGALPDTGKEELLENQDEERITEDYLKVISKNLQGKKRLRLMQELSDAEKNNNIELINDILIDLQKM